MRIIDPSPNTQRDVSGTPAYAYWLDSEFFLTSSREIETKHRAAIWRQVQRIMKLRALFGVPITLSAHQLDDGLPIIWLFNDAGFRRFLSKDPGFLELAGNTTAEIYGNPPHESHFEKVTYALHRMTPSDWIWSVYPDPTPIKRLAEAVLTDRLIEAEAVSHGKRNCVSQVIDSYTEHPEVSKILKGVYWALDFFAQPQQGPHIRIHPWNAEHTLYQKLIDALSHPSLRLEQWKGKGHKEQLEQTTAYVDGLVSSGRIDGRDKNRLSVLFHEMDATFPGPRSRKSKNFRVLRNTLVQAWNAGIQANVSGSNGSILTLPDSPPIAAILGSISDVLVPRQQRGPLELDKSPFQFYPDVVDLPWSKIAQAMDDGDFRATRDAFHQGLRCPAPPPIEELRDAAVAHAKAVQKVVDWRKIPVPKPTAIPWVWLIGMSLNLFGHPQDPPTVAAVSAGVSEGVAGVAWSAEHLRQSLFINTIADQAVKLKPLD